MQRTSARFKIMPIRSSERPATPGAPGTIHLCHEAANSWRVYPRNLRTGVWFRRRLIRPRVYGKVRRLFRGTSTQLPAHGGCGVRGYLIRAIAIRNNGRQAAAESRSVIDLSCVCTCVKLPFSRSPETSQQDLQVLYRNLPNFLPANSTQQPWAIVHRQPEICGSSRAR